MAADSRGPRMSKLGRALLTIAVVIIGWVLVALLSGPVAAPDEVSAVTPALLASPVSDSETESPEVTGGDTSPAVARAAGNRTTETAAATAPEGATHPATGAVAVASAQEQAVAMAVGNPTATPATPATAAPTQMPTPAETPAATPVSGVPTVPVVPPTPVPAAPVPATPVTEPTAAPAPEATPTDAEVPPTPEPTPEATPEPPATLSFEDLANMQAYLAQHRASINDRAFEILSLTEESAPGEAPYFSLRIAASESDSVFASEPPETLMSYGQLLLEDFMRYLGGAPCTVVVTAAFPAASTEACAQAAPWCQVGAMDPDSGTYALDWLYIRMSAGGEGTTVDVWNRVQ